MQTLLKLPHKVTIEIPYEAYVFYYNLAGGNEITIEEQLARVIKQDLNRLTSNGWILDNVIKHYESGDVDKTWGLREFKKRSD
jgi:hypothetical protein